MARRLNTPWNRTCPKCGTSFSAVQQMGICPNCLLRFAAARDGRLLFSYPRSAEPETDETRVVTLPPILFPEAPHRQTNRITSADAKRTTIRRFASPSDSHPQMSAEQVVEFYQQLGFVQFDSTTNILDRYREETGSPFDPALVWNDVYLLSLDDAYVWADDPEADVAHGNQVYCEVLAEWSRVAHGALDLRAIEEHWESDEGPIVVSFWLGDTRYGIDPIYQDDWLDLTVLLQLNGLIAPSGKQLVCASDVNHAVVFVCDDSTRKQLENVRDFPFSV